ncbi:BQ5605_C011g06539 [Microbotryum silenes-dioicae]|uniref:BQ5605_C011g06539 protein n=1 Tax=Microbotryum silenes-dioicae TaxID=796604 RepID=A0A2X0NT93_9BASI|nr:BQ5605_C011g06539 [Microbotryum silenes-dioicae]
MDNSKNTDSSKGRITQKNRFRELRLTICGRSSTAPFAGVTVVLAGDKFSQDAFLLFSSHRLHRSSTLASWNADFWGEMDNSKNTDSCTTAFRSGPTQFFTEPCLYRINIDELFYFQKI